MCISNAFSQGTPELRYAFRSGNLVLSWDESGPSPLVLVYASKLAGPWAEVVGARSPFTTTPVAGKRYYGLGTGPSGRYGPIGETFGARVEENIGTWGVLGGDPGWTETDWVITRQAKWTWIRSGNRSVTPQFRSMSGNFLSPQDGTPVAVFFSAEAYVEPQDKRMFVRALVDGVPLGPEDVVFSSGGASANPETRSFVFTGRVDQGLHTLQMEWLADRESMARIRDAAFLVRLGDSPNSDGSLQIVTPPSGPEVSTRNTSWEDVPGLSGVIKTDAGDTLAISFSAESFVTGGGTMFVRALVDGAPAAPADVLFAKGGDPQCRLMTFGDSSPSAGFHTVSIQWQANGTGAEAFLGDRSLVLSATPALSPQLAQVFVAPPSGAAETTSSTSFSPIPGLSATGALPPNGEIAVLLSAVTALPAGEELHVRLVVDGNPVAESEVQLAQSDEHVGVHSHVFSAKHLYPEGPPEKSTVQLEWRVENGGTAQLDDRTMLVLVKRPTIPDLAEAKPFGTGNTPVEVQGGTRRLVAILWDPHQPGNPAPPSNDVAQALFGPASSVSNYFSVVSGGKFTVTNPLGGSTVLGWYDSLLDWTNYFGGAPGCGSDGGNLELRRREMVTRAAQDINFANFDDNGDGMLDPRFELAVLLVIPYSGPTVDKVRVLYDSDCTWFEVGGVIVPIIAEWLTEYPQTDWRYAAHEIAHLILNLDDLYVQSAINTGAGRFSPMDQILASPHMPHPSAWEKLQLGWVNPTIVTKDGLYALEDVKVSGQVLVLPRTPGKATDEFFLLENRRSAAANDPLYDRDIFGDGIAVWHIIEGQTDNGLPPVCLTAGAWSATGNGNGRRGMRLLRPRVKEESDAFALWSTANYNLLDNGMVCPETDDVPEDRRNALIWADGTPSGYRILNWSAAGPTMTFQIVTP